MCDPLDLHSKPMLEKGTYYLSKETNVRERDCFIDQKKPMLEKGIVYIYQKRPLLEKGIVFTYQKKPMLEKAIVLVVSIYRGYRC